MMHTTGFEFLRVTAYPQTTVVPHVDPPSTAVAKAGKDQTKKGEGDAAPKAAAIETHGTQPKPIPTKPSSPPKAALEERNARPIPSEPKQPMPATPFWAGTGGGERPSTCKVAEFVRPLSKVKIVQEASLPTENKPVLHRDEPLRPPQNAEAESSSGNTLRAAKPISPIAPPVTQEPAKKENAVNYGIYARSSPRPTIAKFPPVENEEKRPKRVESAGQGTGIQESPKRSKVDDAKDMQAANEMGMAKGRRPSVPIIVLGPRGVSHVKSDGEGEGEKPSPGTPSKPSAKLDNDNPGNARENARNATPNEKSNALPVPTSIKENNEGNGLTGHGKRQPQHGKVWVGYGCLSLLHEEALLNQMKKRPINFRMPNVDPLPRTDSLPCVPKFAFIVWADSGIAQGEALAESERVLEACPRGCGTTNAEDLTVWLRNLFTFRSRRITLGIDNVGVFTQVDVANNEVCFGVVPNELSEVHSWTKWPPTLTTQMPRAQIRTPPNFTWPEPKYI